MTDLNALIERLEKASGPDRELDALVHEAAGLPEAAQAVIDRWDTPNWKDAPATAVVINRLRAAISALPVESVQPSIATRQSTDPEVNSATETALREAFIDLQSHRVPWRKALEGMRDRSSTSPYNIDDVSYWEHELSAFDRTFDAFLGRVLAIWRGDA